MSLSAAAERAVVQSVDDFLRMLNMVVPDPRGMITHQNASTEDPVAMEEDNISLPITLLQVAHWHSMCPLRLVVAIPLLDKFGTASSRFLTVPGGGIYSILTWTSTSWSVYVKIHPVRRFLICMWRNQRQNMPAPLAPPDPRGAPLSRRLHRIQIDAPSMDRICTVITRS